MVGELSVRQILSLSNEGCDCEIIARELGLDVAVVKLVLSAHQKGYESDRDINDDELKLLRKKAFSLAMYSEDETVAARMTMFLIERDKPRESKGAGSNIQVINQAIISANENFSNLLKEYGAANQKNGAESISEAS